MLNSILRQKENRQIERAIIRAVYHDVVDHACPQRVALNRRQRVVDGPEIARQQLPQRGQVAPGRGLLRLLRGVVLAHKRRIFFVVRLPVDHAVHVQVLQPGQLALDRSNVHHGPPPLLFLHVKARQIVVQLGLDVIQ